MASKFSVVSIIRSTLDRMPEGRYQLRTAAKSETVVRWLPVAVCTVLRDLHERQVTVIGVETGDKAFSYLSQ